MIGTRYDEYAKEAGGLPFVLYADLERSALKNSKEKNWHEELEIELCESGSGTVLLNGEKQLFGKGDVAVINPNVIHYTSTDSYIRYTCVIINTDFARSVGIDCSSLVFDGLFKSERVASLIFSLKELYLSSEPYKTAKMHSLLIGLLIELAEHHSSSVERAHVRNKAFDNARAVIRYVRENYGKRITLDELAHAVCTDKYTLCRDFKKFSAQTIMEYTNAYRCQKAADLILEGATVAEAARECGFENLSFFTKTFKKNMGALPSSYKK